MEFESLSALREAIDGISGVQFVVRTGTRCFGSEGITFQQFVNLSINVIFVAVHTLCCDACTNVGT